MGHCRTMTVRVLRKMSHQHKVTTKRGHRNFIPFTQSKDPERVSMDNVKGFLSFLTVDKKVAASSQNQAFNALLFLFKHGTREGVWERQSRGAAKRTKCIPVVLSRAEVDRVIRFLPYPYDLVAKASLWLRLAVI